MTIGERIKLAREQKGLTQKQLAGRLNISYVNISQLETGSRDPKMETLNKIAVALDIPLRGLMGIEDFDGFTSEEAEGLAANLDQLLADPVQRKKTLDLNYDRLNDDGQKQAVMDIGHLTEITRYKKNNG